MVFASCLFILLTGCNTKVDNPHGMTATETVQKLFYYWNAKNEKGMRSLEYEKMPKGESQFYYLISVKLNRCTESEDFKKGTWSG